ncbi:MAG: N-acetylmuramoyl-L-alanine amidase [Elusimicrobia bacterium]|nr:N-acetylmuramoyl-L-alanine amidase [Elusimicrobiota bacterium]
MLLCGGVRILVFLFLQGAGVLFAAGLSQLPAVVNGEYLEKVQIYEAGRHKYLSAEAVGKIYGARVYWYQVAGRVVFSWENRRLELWVGTPRVLMGEKEIRLGRPVLLRGGQAYLPLEFLLHRDFSDWAGYDSSYDFGREVLTVDRRSNLGSPRYFSYPDRLRMALELGPEVSYHPLRRARGRLEILLMGGVPSKSRQWRLEDPAVHSFGLVEQKRLSRLWISLGKEAMRWELQEKRNPRRLILDVYRRTAASAAPQTSPSVFFQKGEGKSNQKRRIAIDAGHGGRDGGAVGRRGTLEKDINLRVARDLAELLRQEDQFEVLLTRRKDATLSLLERTRKANRWDADLFISIHCNAATDSAMSGFEVYYLSEQASDPRAAAVARFENASGREDLKALEKEFKALEILSSMHLTEKINESSVWGGLLVRELQMRVDLAKRGLKQAHFYVLRGNRSPSVLVELGFLTHAADEAKLQNPRFRKKLVDGIYAGIIAYSQRRWWEQAALSSSASKK